jgi:hypothetical protein
MNKGETKNALAPGVFFNRLGEPPDPKFENQRYRASGLNLVVAAIFLWNTVYLERTFKELCEASQLVKDSLLRHLSPLGLEHIKDRPIQIRRWLPRGRTASRDRYETIPAPVAMMMERRYMGTQ